MTTTIDAPTEGPTVAQQAPVLLGLLAGYVGHRTVEMGLRQGLLAALADGGPTTSDDLAERLGLDRLYTSVWVRAAVAAGVCDRDGDRVALAPQMATLLLDEASPAYVGGVFTVLSQREVFDRFSDELASGERMWWSDCSPEWIAGVSGTGRPFYTRLVPGGLGQVPGLAERLDAGCRVVDHACGAGVGLVRLAEHYPACDLVGVDGDAHSLELAAARLADAGLDRRATLVHSPLEDMAIEAPATLVVNNISMHECRDIDRVTEAVRASLEPSGWFVISDFPFPADDDALRTPPGRVMSGIQFFEAQIDDQLLPRAAYDDLLTRHGFVDLGTVQLTPMHALTWGRKSA